MSNCRVCGADSTGARFCTTCGTDQSVAPQFAPPSAAPPTTLTETLTWPPAAAGVSRSRRNRWLIAGGAALATAVLAAAAIVLIQLRGEATDGATSSPSGGIRASAIIGSTGGTSAGAPAGKSAVVLSGGATTGRTSAAGGSAAAGQKVQPQAASASSTAPGSVDDKGVAINYAAQNTIDGDPATAWRAAEGDGVGQELVLTLPATTALTSVGLIPGYAKVDPATGVDRFPQNRRIARVSWIFDDGTSVEQAFADDRTLQIIPVKANTRSVRVKILESRPSATPADARNYTPISEVSLTGS